MPENQEMMGSWMCAQHHLLGVTCWNVKFWLVLLHSTKVKFYGRRYDNRGKFSSMVPWGEEKKNIFKIIIFYKCLGYNMHLK